MDYINKLAIEFAEEYPRESLEEYKVEDLKDWIIESHDVSQNFIYKEIEFDSKPSEKYMKKAYEIVKKRIALGGYRLAKILRNIKAAFDEADHKNKDKKFLAIME